MNHSDRDKTIEDLPGLLAAAAAVVLERTDLTGALCDAPCADAVKYARPSKSLQELNAIILEQIQNIGESVQVALNREYGETPAPRDIAFANAELNQAHGNSKDYTAVSEGTIDAFSIVLLDGQKKMKKLYETLVASAPHFQYLFDLRLNTLTQPQTLLSDLEGVFKDMMRVRGVMKSMKRLVIVHQAGDDKASFEVREKKLRSEVERQYNVKISEVLSNAKLLLDDFEKLIDELKNVVRPKDFNLKTELLMQYFFTAETFTNPLGRGESMIADERTSPGEIGLQYQERLTYFLDLFKRAIIAMNIVERTLLLVECRL